MSDDMILFVAAAVFLLLLIGLGFTVWEFKHTVDPSPEERADPDKGSNERER